MSVREALEETLTDLDLDGKDINPLSENRVVEEVQQAEEVEQEAPQEVSSIESTAPDVEKNGEQQEIAQADEAPAIPVVPPPSGWRGDAKELFAKLPPELQHEVARRESDRDRFLHQTRQKFAELDKVFQPHEETFNRKGINLASFVERAISWDKYIQESPHDAIREMAELTGVNLQQLANVVEAALPQDPYLRQLMEQNKALEAKFSEIEREKEEGRRKATEGQYLSLVQEVESFQNARDAQGNMMFPYVNLLEKDMEVIIPRVQAEYPGASTRQVLEESYSRAVRANPTTYSQYERDLIAKQKASLSESVQKKKSAAVSISGSATGAKTTNANASVRDILKEVGSEMGIF